MVYWQFPPYIILLTLSALISGTLAVYAWRQHTPGARSFAWLMLSASIWSLGAALTQSSTEIAVVFFLLKAKQIGVYGVPVMWLIFTVQYTGREKWLTPRNLALGSVIPLITLVLIWTNEWHGLYFSNFELDTGGPLVKLRLTRAPWYWVGTFYAYLLFFGGMGSLIHMFIHSSRLYRRQIGVILVGGLAPWLGNIIFNFGPNPFPGLDFTPVTFTIAGIIVAWGLFRYKLLDIVPIARDKVVESMSAGVIVLDARSRIVDMNPAAQKLIGRTPAEAIGQPVEQIFSRWPDLVERYRDVPEAHTQIVGGETPEQRCYDLHISPLYNRQRDLTGRVFVVRDITHHKQTEEALHQLNQELEQRVETRTQELKAEIIERQQIEAELQNSLKRMKIAYEQATIYARELIEEIAERKQAQMELKRSHGDLVALNTIITMIGQSRDLSHILTTMLDLVLVIVEAAAGYIQLLDEESGRPYLVAQKGLSPETVQAIEAVQSSCSPFLFEQTDLLHVPQAKELSKVIKRAGWYPLIKIPLKCKDTILGCMEILGRTSCELDKEQVKLLEAIGHQVSIAIENERLTKRAAETRVAQELDYLRSELISNVSHELRTPLGLIKAASTTLLRQDIEFDQKTRETLLRGIDEETDRLEHIVNNLLDLSRLEQKRLTLDRSVIDLGQLIRSVIESMQPRIQPKLQVDFNSPPQPLVANVDAKHIEQVLRNLLTNAIKYSPDGGTITIEMGQNKKELIIQFKDQGIGIPAADLKKIFERFYRVDNDITRDVSGAGLGLAISRELVEAHGGRMWAESEGGTGSTFYFTLPLESESEA